MSKRSDGRRDVMRISGTPTQRQKEFFASRARFTAYGGARGGGGYGGRGYRRAAAAD